MKRELALAFSLTFTGAIGSNADTNQRANSSCEPTQSASEILYGEAVCIAPGEVVNLQADFEEDLQANIVNLGDTDADSWSEVDADFMGTSPFPVPNHHSFGGIRWRQLTDGNVNVLFYTAEKASQNPHTWNFVNVEQNPLPR